MDYESPDTELQSSKKETAEKPQNLFEKLVGFFVKSGDPEKEKKRLLKEIGKELKRKSQKFYSPRNESVLPGLAQYMFEIYKVLGPARSS